MEKNSKTSKKKEELAPIMTVRDVAKLLKLSKITIYKLAKTGQIPSFRVGSSLRFRKEKILEILAG